MERLSELVARYGPDVLVLALLPIPIGFVLWRVLTRARRQSDERGAELEDGDARDPAPELPDPRRLEPQHARMRSTGMVSGYVAYVGVALLLLRKAHSDDPELSWAMTALVFAAPLLLMWLLGRVLFHRRIQVSQDGVTSRGALGTRALAWADVAQVRVKTGSLVNGWRVPSKVVLRGADGTCITVPGVWDLTSVTDDPVVLALASHLVAVGGPSVHEALAAALRSPSAWFARPHREEAVQALLGLALAFGGIRFALVFFG